MRYRFRQSSPARSEIITMQPNDTFLKTRVKMSRHGGQLTATTNCDNNYLFHRLDSVAKNLICLLLILLQMTCLMRANGPTTTLQTLIKPNDTLSDTDNNLMSSRSSNNSELNNLLVTSPDFGPIVEDLHAVESHHIVSNESSSTRRDFIASPPYSTVISLLPPLISFVPSTNTRTTTIVSFAPNTTRWPEDAGTSYSRIENRDNYRQLLNNYLQQYKNQSSNTTTNSHNSISNYNNNEQFTLFDVNDQKQQVNGVASINNRTTKYHDNGHETTNVSDEVHELRARQRTLDTVLRQAHENLLDSVMVTNKTRAFLSCETGDMLIKINFSEPFRGVAYTNYDRLTPCKLYGDGSQYYELRVPLRGCGTRQEAPRFFLNNILIRFHRSLELETDEVKTIVCRYPPPMAAPPGQIPRGPPERIIEGPREAAKLTYFDPLLIISGLLFVTLLLLSLGLGVVAIKRRGSREILTSNESKVPIPPSIVAQTVYDSFVDTKSIIETNDVTTLNKRTIDLYGTRPKLASKITDHTTQSNQVDRHEIGSSELNKTFVKLPVYLIKNIEDIYTTKVDEIDEVIRNDVIIDGAPSAQNPISTIKRSKERAMTHDTFTKSSSTTYTHDDTQISDVQHRLSKTATFNTTAGTTLRDDNDFDTRSIETTASQTTVHEGAPSMITSLRITSSISSTFVV